jgi:hypothetical protein
MIVSENENSAIEIRTKRKPPEIVPLMRAKRTFNVEATKPRRK